MRPSRSGAEQATAGRGQELHNGRNLNLHGARALARLSWPTLPFGGKLENGGKNVQVLINTGISQKILIKT
jgi:hypothetical protein